MTIALSILSSGISEFWKDFFVFGWVKVVISGQFGHVQASSAAALAELYGRNVRRDGAMSSAFLSLRS